MTIHRGTIVGRRVPDADAVYSPRGGGHTHRTTRWPHNQDYGMFNWNPGDAPWPANDYRLKFWSSGGWLHGQIINKSTGIPLQFNNGDYVTGTDIYEVPDPGYYSSGVSGLFSYVRITHSSADGVDPTFDNFYSGAAAPDTTPPTVTINQAGGPGRSDERFADQLHGGVQRSGDGLCHGRRDDQRARPGDEDGHGHGQRHDLQRGGERDDGQRHGDRDDRRPARRRTRPGIGTRRPPARTTR